MLQVGFETYTRVRLDLTGKNFRHPCSVETLKVPGREEDFCNGLKQAIAYAAAVNCKAIHIMVGNLIDAEQNHRATLIKNLNWAAPLLAAKGIIGCPM